MYFPKLLVSAKYLGFACRGGSSYPDQRFSNDKFKADFIWTFYIHLDNGKYQKIIYRISEAEIPVDNGGNTAFVNFPINEQILQGAAAMSFEWKASEALPSDLTDNYKDKTKEHLALMLYEVFIGESTWH